jgi:hypothetical protein
MRLVRAALLACVLCLVLVASAAGAGPIVRATLTTSTAKPVVDTPWRFTLRVRDQAKKPLGAKARLQLLLGQTVVGCWKGSAMAPCQSAAEGTWIAFTGRRSGVLTFPAQSVGITLTFQAVVVARGRTVRLRAPVTVQAAP